MEPGISLLGNIVERDIIKLVEWDIVCRVGISFENSLSPPTFGGGCEVKEFDLVKLDFDVEDTIGFQLVQRECAATRRMEGF